MLPHTLRYDSEEQAHLLSFIIKTHAYEVYYLSFIIHYKQYEEQ